MFNISHKNAVKTNVIHEDYLSGKTKSQVRMTEYY